MAMSEIVQKMQFRIKSSSFNIFTFSLKIFTGCVLGLTFALIGQEMIGYGDLAFFLFITVVAGAFLKIAKKWNFMGVLLFDVVCILVGMLLRMYILIAPGA